MSLRIPRSSQARPELQRFARASRPWAQFSRFPRFTRYGLGAAVSLSLVACGGGDALEPSAQVQAAGDRAQSLAAGTQVTPAAATTAAGTILRASSTASGTPADRGSTTCAVSADGRMVLFASDATNLVAGDTNRTADLFLKNLNSGAISRVTTQSNGAQLAAGGNCLGTTMTPDARIVAFNSGQAVFAKNTQTGQLTQASPPAGTVPQVASFFGGVVSDDGTKLVFMTVPETVFVGGYEYANVIPARLMLRDLGTGSLVTLATDNGIVQQGQIFGSRFAISPDGTRVAFISTASLVPGDTNGQPDVFVRDLVSGSTTLASSSSNGAPATPVVSGFLQYFKPNFISNHQLAYLTGQPSSLGAGGLYLKDLTSGELSLALSSAQGGGTASLSGDGNTLVLTRVYSGWNSRVFLRDRASGAETLVSASATGVASNGNGTGALISRDGTHVVFGSNASNLLSPRPPAGVFQVYAKQTSVSGTARQ